MHSRVTRRCGARGEPSRWHGRAYIGRAVRVPPLCERRTPTLRALGASGTTHTTSPLAPPCCCCARRAGEAGMPSNAQTRSPVGATFSADSVTAVPPLSGPTDGLMPLRTGGSCASYRVNGTVEGPKCSPSSETLRVAAPRSPLAGAAHRSRLGDSSVPSCSEPSPTRHESWPPAAKPEPRTVRSGGCRRPRDEYAGATSLTAGGSCSALAAGRWRRVHTIIGASPKSQLFRPHLAGARSATWTPP